LQIGPLFVIFCRKIPKSKQLQGSQSLLQAMPRGSQPLVQKLHLAAYKRLQSLQCHSEANNSAKNQKQNLHSLSTTNTDQTQEKLRKPQEQG